MTPNPHKYAPEALTPDGLLLDPSVVSDSLQATLGKYGMTHALLSPDMPAQSSGDSILPPGTIPSSADTNRSLAEQARTDRLTKEFGELGATLEGRKLLGRFESSYRASKQLFELSGMTMPLMDSPELLSQLFSLKPIFELYEKQGLEPEVILNPEHQSQGFWSALGTTLEGSPLNPDEPNPDYDPNVPAQQNKTRKVIRNGGLWVSDQVSNNWTSLTNPDNQPPAWALSVMSQTNRPTFVSTTSYGYTDSANQEPSPTLNGLLASRGLPQVEDRTPNRSSNSRQPPLTQPDIHPSLEAYTTAQFIRIIQNKPPLDSNTYSWLRGVLPSGNVPAGSWVPGDGQVNLGNDVAGRLRDYVGVRPSGRGQTLVP